MKVRDVVESAVSEVTLRQLSERMRRTRGFVLSGDPVKSVEVIGTKYLLNEQERSGVLRHLISGGDLSGYGLVNAVTHYSQEVPDYDRATEFEVLGGKLLSLPDRDWKVRRGVETCPAQCGDIDRHPQSPDQREPDDPLKVRQVQAVVQAVRASRDAPTTKRR